MEERAVYPRLINQSTGFLHLTGSEMDVDQHKELNAIIDRADQEIAAGVPLENVHPDMRTSKRSTMEAAMAVWDSKLVAICCAISKEQAEAIDANLDSFSPSVFADNIVSHMEGSPLFARAGILDWSMLAESTAKCFRMVPSFTCMLGGLPENQQPVVIRERKIRVAAAPAAETRRPINVTTENSMEKEEEGIDEIVLDMYKQLLREFKRNNSKPVCYFKFLLHPRSFGASVENMFYMSFLIKENRVKLDHNELGLPVLEPMRKEKAANGSESTAENRQALTSLTPIQHREMVQLLNIQVPMIKRRLPEDVEPVAGPSRRQ